MTTMQKFEVVGLESMKGGLVHLATEKGLRVVKLTRECTPMWHSFGGHPFGLSERSRRERHDGRVGGIFRLGRGAGEARQ